MQILNGKEVSKTHRLRIQSEVNEFSLKYRHPPKLAVVLVGNNVASHIYVQKKEEACQRVGILSERHSIDQNEPVEKLDNLLETLNQDKSVHAILVQLPLPQAFQKLNILDKLNPIKDVDGLTFDSVGRLCCQQKRIVPCTPQGIMAIFKHYNIDVAGQTAVVVGRSQIVGKPMFHLLMQANATVTMCHSRTQNLANHTRQADLVVVAAGKPRFLGRDDFKEGAVVIDVGIHRNTDGTLCGDVRFEELDGHASAITPVPGGVGPMTVTMLLQNTLELAKLQKVADALIGN